MNATFPVYSRSAKSGDQGVSVVSRIVLEELAWLFVQRHQEHDFGIDGQIEYVSDDGSVTGQAFGVQIKYGKSFFQEKNRWGYVYRGERRHFNYLSNYPLPVLIIIVHMDGTAYWELFDPALTEQAGENWKLTVPFSKRLSSSKASLVKILGPAQDKYAALSDYWETNKLLKESPAIHLSLDRKEEVGKMDTSYPRLFFNRMLVTKELALSCQGKVEISFAGYKLDSRELFEIPEVRAYVSKLVLDLPELFFFHRTSMPTQGLSAIALCLTESEWIDGRSTPLVTRQLTLEFAGLERYLNHLFAGLNDVTDWLGMSDNENEVISAAAASCWGIRPEAT